MKLMDQNKLLNQRFKLHFNHNLNSNLVRLQQQRVNKSKKD